MLCIYSVQPALSDFNREEVFKLIQKLLDADYVLTIQGEFAESGNLKTITLDEETIEKLPTV